MHSGYYTRHNIGNIFSITPSFRLVVYEKKSRLKSSINNIIEIIKINKNLYTEKIYEFLAGAIDGDGSVKTRTLTITSSVHKPISKILILLSEKEGFTLSKRGYKMLILYIHRKHRYSILKHMQHYKRLFALHLSHIKLKYGLNTAHKPKRAIICVSKKGLVTVKSKDPRTLERLAMGHKISFDKSTGYYKFSFWARGSRNLQLLYKLMSVTEGRCRERLEDLINSISEKMSTSTLNPTIQRRRIVFKGREDVIKRVAELLGKKYYATRDGRCEVHVYPRDIPALLKAVKQGHIKIKKDKLEKIKKNFQLPPSLPSTHLAHQVLAVTQVLGLGGWVEPGKPAMLAMPRAP